MFDLLKGKYVVIIGIIGGIASLAVLIGFVGQGNVRGVEIFWPERVEQTVIIQEDENDKAELYGLKGVKGGPNPTLISRTSFAYVLTIINEGELPHQLYIESFDVKTNVLEPGDQDTIVIVPEKEGIYNYYDIVDGKELLGKIRIVSVVPGDEFQGIWKDLI